MGNAAEEQKGIGARDSRPEESKESPAAGLSSALLESGGTEIVSSDGERTVIPRELPVLPSRDTVVFPGTVVPLTIGREKSKRLIDSVLAGNKLLGVFAQRREEVEDPDINDIYWVGTAAVVLKLLRMPDGTNTLLVHGVVRIGIEKMLRTEPYWTALINPQEDKFVNSLELEALAYSARRTAEEVMDLAPNVPQEARIVLNNIERPDALADFLAANLSLGIVQKQELLETFDVSERLRKVNATLNNQLEVLNLSKKIQTDVRDQIEKSQREYFLNEQLKAIHKELGDDEGVKSDIEELKARIDKAGMPENVLKDARRELKRLERAPQGAAETSIIREYLEWLAEMPWTSATQDHIDLKDAENILNEDHYGLPKIKRRILEYLAVLKLRQGGHAPILCFVGPPGVGKTSLGQSIARALGRKFIRISLGGVRDEADIRGHRRTYIGAIPGRIVQEIRKAGTNNPVIMLDEMDKIGSDFRGDPAAALLEVLDPQQNSTFTDHYLGVPFDLSKVLFIGTANLLDPISPPLRDRMEVIELSGYTLEEKLQIARRYLVPRQKAENGLEKYDVKFEDDALRNLVENYTLEAGVRNLERVIGAVCRAIAAKVARDENADLSVDPEDLEAILGPARYDRELAGRVPIAGVATGLAYTPMGGGIIFVEATRMPGKGSFTLTGQIGEVMKESAHAALSLMRSRAETWGLSLKDVSTTDVHIHVPAGAIPKDGPSAGVAMLTALVSLFAREPADPSIGMTGEITLRGLVLPIGGVKEKVLGAHRAGLKTVVLPARNKPDLEEVSAEVRKEVRFVFAETVDQVLAEAIPTLKQAKTPKPPAGKPRTSRNNSGPSNSAGIRGRSASATRSKRLAAGGT